MPNTKRMKSLAALVASAAVLLPCAAQNQDAAKKDQPQPNEAEMMAMMMELAKPGENHKLLARGVGTWTYQVKFWMNPDPNAPPTESSGTSVVKEALEGRFFIGEHAGKMQMPGPDGKPTDMDFKGMSIEGYDNVKKKFVSMWMDNMGTGIMNAEGTYDPNKKAFTYHAEYEAMPGMKNKIREVITIVDNDHHTFEYFENRGGQEVRTMEIKYTRKR